MRYSQDLTGVFSEAGVSRSRFDHWLKRAREEASRMAAERHRGTLPMLAVADQNADLQAFELSAARLLEGTSDLVVLGTGGSSLGAQALAQLTGRLTPAPPDERPSVHFFDNLDGETLAAAFHGFGWPRTAILAVSKSGATPETLMQVLAAHEASAGKARFCVVTQPGESALRKFAKETGSPALEHPANIGGRFSVFSITGMLPARLMGLDCAAVRAGAREVLDGLDKPDSLPAQGAALHAAAMEEKKLPVAVLWAYADRLERFGAWWRQLWAESLGKNGEGTTPVSALGPVDQHSQLQLYLSGPNDKLFTVLYTDAAGTGPRAAKTMAEIIGAGFLAGKVAGDLVAAEARATVETLKRNKRPVRALRVPRLDEAALGALFAHFMTETILAARLIGVDPFGQPAVEEGKMLARKYLGGEA